jgi:predicted nucleic-acid-binding Zn-ribbon protein
MNQSIKFTCPKCGGKECEIGEMWTVGSFWTRMFELHNRRFTYISCRKCHFTELYKIPKKNIGEILTFWQNKSDLTGL